MIDLLRQHRLQRSAKQHGKRYTRGEFRVITGPLLHFLQGEIKFILQAIALNLEKAMQEVFALIKV